MLTLIFGENNSGKSDFAEKYVMAQGIDRIYLATMLCADQDARNRIRRHKELRKDRGFLTVEYPLFQPELIEDMKGNLLLEDLANLVANERFEKDGGGREAVEKTLTLLIEKCDNVTVVSNTFERYRSEEELSGETLSYMEEISYWNRRLLERAETVVEVKDKNPIVRKGSL